MAYKKYLFFFFPIQNLCLAFKQWKIIHACYSCFRPGTNFKDMTNGSHSLKVAMSGIRHKNFEENLLSKKTVKFGLLQTK